MSDVTRGPSGSVIITGASRGIGAATARRLVADGVAVAICYAQNDSAANAVLNQLKAAGGVAIAVRADVSEEREVQRLFERVDAELPPLQGLVNNAGIIGRTGTIQSLDAAAARRLLEVNILGSILCAREAVARLALGQGNRSIVNVSSAAARLGSPNEFLDYAASKGAIDTFTLGLSKEVAPHGIRVNAVRPGLIETGMHAATGDPARLTRAVPNIPMRRAGTADEVAQVIAWLLSDQSSYVTGALVDVAGGR